MTRATVLQEVRQMRFEKLSARWQQRILTMAEAGEMRGVTEGRFAAGVAGMTRRGPRGCTGAAFHPARCPWMRRSAW